MNVPRREYRWNHHLEVRHWPAYADEDGQRRSSVNDLGSSIRGALDARLVFQQFV